MMCEFLINLKWILSELYLAFHRMLFALKMVHQYKKHLKPGSYVLKNGSKIIIGRRGIEKSAVYLCFPIMDGINEPRWKRIFLSCLDALVSIPLIIKRSNKDSQKADILMTTINGDVKLFVLENNTVLTFVKDETKYSRLKCAWNSFLTYFNIPLQQFDDKNLLIKEQLIRNQKRWNDTEMLKVFNEVIDNYKKYIMCEKSKIHYVTYNEIAGVCKDKMKKCNVYLQELFDNTFSNVGIPMLPIHGDLHFGNILINDLSSFFIDWESMRNDWLLYDIFNMMYVLAVYQQNYLLIDMYLEGRFDHKFNELCKIAGIDTTFFSRKHFLLIFLIQRFVFDPVPEICCKKIPEFLLYCQEYSINCIGL